VDHNAFVKPENWYGSHYELCFELGPSGDDATLLSALRCLWSLPQLAGPWIDPHAYGGRTSVFAIADDSVPMYHGVLTIPDGHRVGCLTCVLREPDGSDWLDLCIPEGMLELVYDISYPLYFSPNPWMTVLTRFSFPWHHMFSPSVSFAWQS